MWNDIKNDSYKKAPYVNLEAEDKARCEHEMAERDEWAESTSEAENGYEGYDATTEADVYT